jgi:hypothetical protein
MNSLLQQLFMIPAVRAMVLEVRPNVPSLLDVKPHGTQLAGLLTELQRTFAFLLLSTQRSYDPLPLVQSLRDVPAGFFPMASDIADQNDAHEFFNLLLDRLGGALGSVEGAPSDAAAAAAPDPMQRIFGGTLVHQLIGVKNCSHKSNRDEAFTCASVALNNKSTLEECLEAFIQVRGAAARVRVCVSC